MTDTPPIDSRRARLSLRLLAPEDVERLYAAALDRLASDGVAPAGDEARAALLAAGAGESRAEGALRLPAEIVEEAAARAPKRVALGGRSPEDDVVLEPGAALLGAGGWPASQAEPLAGGPPQRATPKDVEDACRLADALGDVSVIVGPPVSAGHDAAQAAEIGRALRTTTKHVQLAGVSSPTVAAAAADMAAALRDGEADLRRRPPLSLSGGAASFAAASALAARGLPVGVLVARPGAGQVAGPPATDVTGALVGFIADVLAANAAIQALAPGAAFVAPVWPGLAGLPASGPDAALFIVAATQVLTRAGLPAAAAAFATSASGPDWLACTDGAFAALSAAAAGAALLTGAGTLRDGAVFSPRELVADAEIHSWCASVAAGIVVDDETLAVDVIKDVGIGGNFLGQRHTRRHMKDVWRPRLLDRTPWDAWVAGGRRGAADAAADLAGSLLAQHAAEPLDAERAATLERIIATAGL